MLVCLQAKLAELGLEMDPEEFVKGLPPHIKRRVEALQELQKTRDEIEGRFKKEKAELEARYEKLYSKMILAFVPACVAEYSEF